MFYAKKSAGNAKMGTQSTDRLRARMRFSECIDARIYEGLCRVNVMQFCNMFVLFVFMFIFHARVLFMQSCSSVM